MSSGYKLYPPIIGESIPAFYEENGTAVIAVPFSINRAVDPDEIVGLKIKIKTVQSNTLLKTIEIESGAGLNSMITNRIARFEWRQSDEAFSKIAIGQFLKIQIAFLSAAPDSSTSVVTGYFSNVGIIKYTAKPKIYILNGEAENPNGTALFKMNYIGVYNTQGDISERPYSYCFTLYDSERNVVESSGWLLHNSSVTYTVSESLSVDSVIDTYTYTSSLVPNELYYIQYSVRTINNLEIHSPIYSCMDIPVGRPVVQTVLKAENNFDNGYIQLKFIMPIFKYFTRAMLEDKEEFRFWYTAQLLENHSSTIIPRNQLKTDYNAKNIKILTTEYYDASIIKNALKNNLFPWVSSPEEIYYFLKSFTIISTSSDSAEKKIRLSTYQAHLNALIKYLEQDIDNDTAVEQILPNPITIIIERSDWTNNYENWQIMQQKYFTTYSEMILDWEFKDFTIEQGIYYKYSFRQININNIMTDRDIANFNTPIMANFEDMFLYDGKQNKQLKIRFNPKVTSFKTTQMEQKIETLGSRYPFIFKNGVVNYKEFPISGLISYNSDNEELFINYEQDLGIVLPEKILRTQSHGKTESQNIELNDYFDNLINTYSISDYNMRAERIFKTKVLEWLNDGNIKLFKSPSEGNYLIRLMNVSLSPEDRLGRMLHNFTAQAYEVEELTFENLKNLEFIPSTNGFEKQTLTITSVNVYDKFIKPLTSKPNRNNPSFCINGENEIINYLIFEPTENTETINGIDFRIGGDSSQNKVLVFTHSGLDLSITNAILPNVYFNIYDNIDNMNDNQPNATGDAGSTIISDDSSWATIKKALQTLLSDVVVTYGYYSTENPIGLIGNIKNVYIQNKIQTHIGPWNKSISTNVHIPIEGSGTLEQILKYIILDFNQKEVIDLTLYNNKYYDSNRRQVPKANWDPLCIYRIMKYDANKAHTVDTIPQPGKQYYQLTMQNNIPYYEKVDNLTGINLASYYSWEATTEDLWSSSGGSFSSIRSTGIDTGVELVLEDGSTVTSKKPPVILNLNNKYQSIKIKNGIYLQSAYQARIIEYYN